MEAPTVNTLVRKLTEVMACLHRVPKTGHNAFHNYDYVTESDVLEAVRGHLSERGILLFPDVIEHKREPKVGGKGYISDIMVRWQFIDSESGETLSMVMPGSGEDVGEKSLYKALTGSSKYLLLKTFLIASGEDPELENQEPPVAPLPTRPASVPKQPPVAVPDTASVNGGQIWEGQLINVNAKTITSKQSGKQYVIHEFVINTTAGNQTAGAGFNEELVNQGKLSVGAMIRAQIVPGNKRGFFNIESFEVVG